MNTDKIIAESIAKEYAPKELADVIMKNAIFLSDGGGVTFSGGEPLLQAEFVTEVASILKKDS